MINKIEPKRQKAIVSFRSLRQGEAGGFSEPPSTRSRPRQRKEQHVPAGDTSGKPPMRPPQPKPEVGEADKSEENQDGVKKSDPFNHWGD